MISDKKLIYISLIISMVGFLSMVAITMAIEPRYVSVSQITSEMTGQEITTRGIIDSYFTNEGNVFITLKNRTSVKVVMFSREAGKQPWVYDLRKGDSIAVEGKVQIYKNELEIVADKITAISLS
ncbi:MAG: OB-fold nucleic acid binding domain-containing protein [Candidatus Aenigmarchaeota archaeon]|nr:OB-fold nucleic acid binding domain-containing protein [Candidatus Aenigmarchaeota archaeon]